MVLSQPQQQLGALDFIFCQFSFIDAYTQGNVLLPDTVWVVKFSLKCWPGPMRFISNELCCCDSFWRVCREIRSIYNCVFTDRHARHNEMGSAIGRVHLPPPSCFILTISPCGTCSSELISCSCPSLQTWNFIILHCYAHIPFFQDHMAKKLRRVK